MKVISAGDKHRARVLIVDDHPVFRHGFKRLVNEEPDLVVCAETGDPAEAGAAARRHHPDIIVLNISLDGPSGLVLIRSLRADFPSLPVLVISTHKEPLFAERALRAGAGGFVTKQDPPEMLLTAIRQVLQGQRFISLSLGERLGLAGVEWSAHGEGSPFECLSDRELQVFQLIGRGKGTRQIAEQLRLSIKTIESYRAHIKDKMNLQTASELVQTAIYWVQQHRKPD